MKSWESCWRRFRRTSVGKWFEWFDSIAQGFRFLVFTCVRGIAIMMWFCRRISSEGWTLWWSGLLWFNLMIVKWISRIRQPVGFVGFFLRLSIPSPGSLERRPLLTSSLATKWSGTATHFERCPPMAEQRSEVAGWAPSLGPWLWAESASFPFGSSACSSFSAKWWKIMEASWHVSTCNRKFLSSHCLHGL